MPMVKFVPSSEQREVVAALSAAKMPLEKIAASIVNPRTQRAISVKTLGRMFKDQLDAGVGTIVKAFQGLRAALENKEPWAIKYTLDHIAEFKAKEKDPQTSEAVKQGLLEIRVTGVEPLPVQDPAPVGEVIDLLANKDPLKRIPSRDPSPPPWADEPQPEPPPVPHNQGGTLLRGNSPYRTELDIPDALVPWYKRNN
jgi:hypothetical protein